MSEQIFVVKKLRKNTEYEVILDSEGLKLFNAHNWSVRKGSKSERNAGLEGMPEKLSIPQLKTMSDPRMDREQKREPQANHHPTVKPIKLMQYLINLVTPPQGTVLDPFMGSGSTGVAAKNINCKFIGIELNEEYFEIAKKRIENCKQNNLSNGAEIR